MSDYAFADMVRKSRSGTKWTEADYKAAGIQLLHLRLKPENHEPLDELAKAWGVTRGEAVKRAIDEAHGRHVAPYAADQTPEASGVATIEPVAHPGQQLNTGSGTTDTDKSE